MDAEFPDYFSGKNTDSADEIYDFCKRSENCHFIKEYASCRDVNPDTIGTCISWVDRFGDETTEKETTRRDCIGVFIGPDLEQGSAEECSKIGGAVEYEFECTRLQKKIELAADTIFGKKWGYIFLTRRH